MKMKEFLVFLTKFLGILKVYKQFKYIYILKALPNDVLLAALVLRNNILHHLNELRCINFENKLRKAVKQSQEEKLFLEKKFKPNENKENEENKNEETE